MKKAILALSMALIAAVPVIQPVAVQVWGETAGSAVTGGWSLNEDSDSLADHPDALDAFNKAVAGTDKDSYEPVALLGSQVVSGTNYCILCRDYSGDEKTLKQYVLLYIYADLEGNAEIMNTSGLDISKYAGNSNNSDSESGTATGVVKDAAMHSLVLTLDDGSELQLSMNQDSEADTSRLSDGLTIGKRVCVTYDTDTDEVLSISDAD